MSRAAHPVHENEEARTRLVSRVSLSRDNGTRRQQCHDDLAIRLFRMHHFGGNLICQKPTNVAEREFYLIQLQQLPLVTIKLLLRRTSYRRGKSDW